MGRMNDRIGLRSLQHAWCLFEMIEIGEVRLDLSIGSLRPFVPLLWVNLRLLYSFISLCQDVRHSLFFILPDVYQGLVDLWTRLNLGYLDDVTIWLLRLHGFLSGGSPGHLSGDRALQAGFHVYRVWGLLGVELGGINRAILIIGLVVDVTVTDCASLLLELSEMHQRLTIAIFGTFS